MSDNIFVGLINNAALLLALGLIYDILSREKRTTFPVLTQLTGLINKPYNFDQFREVLKKVVERVQKQAGKS